MHIISRFVVLFLALFSGAITAKEGFWLPNQLNSVQQKIASEPAAQALIEKVDLAALPLDALVRINECSASFVSSTGLILAHADCLIASLEATSKETLLLAQPFLATNFEHEISLPSLQGLLFADKTNVTVHINRKLSGMDDMSARAKMLVQIKKELVRECQLNFAYCEVLSLSYGVEHHLVKFNQVPQLKLVHVPDAMASYAQDNEWGWPRYDAKFVFLRATNADGSAFNTPSFFAVAGKGAAAGSTLISAGFPKKSARYADVSEIRYLFETRYPHSVLQHEALIALINQLAPIHSEKAQRYQAELSTLNKQMLLEKSMVARYQKSELLAKKEAQKRRLIQWIQSGNVRKQLYEPRLAQLDALLAKQQFMVNRDSAFSFLRHAKLPTLALDLYKLALARENAITEADMANVEKVQKSVQKRVLNLQEEFDERVDRELSLHLLKQYARLPMSARIQALDNYFALGDTFNVEVVRHKIEAMYRGTVLKELNKREFWLHQSAKQFEASHDPMLHFAQTLYLIQQAIERERFELQSELAVIMPSIMEIHHAYADVHDELFYPDANGDLRLSIGRVRGYQPSDAIWYQPFSTLKGLIAKESEIKQSAPMALPVNFLSTIDSCGCFNGAPTLNARGELVGMLLSGVEENQLAYWHYDEQASRSVHLDIRYVIWLLKQKNETNRLLKEMSIKYES